MRARLQFFQRSILSVLLPVMIGLLTPIAPAGVGTSPIRVLVMDETRTRFCGDAWDSNFLTGNVFEDARSWVLSPSNFGPGGVVGRNIELTSVNALTNFSLSNADVVLLSLFDPEKELDACEIERLQAFVNQGGGLFVFENHAADLYVEMFGGMGENSSGGNTGTFQGDIVNQGPFGNVQGSTMSLAFHRTLDDLGPNGRALLNDSATSVVAAAFDFGLGRAVLISDEEWVSSYLSNVGCGVPSSDLPLARLFFLNSVAYVTPSDGFSYEFSTELCCPADITNDGSLNFFDISAFLSAFAAGDLIADFTGDGAFNFFDISAFLQAFSKGCP